MSGKMADTRFTIQFSRTDPTHLQVADILNKQGRRSKAQYIVNAVLHYENCGETPIIKRPAGFDEKVIEAVVNRILQEKEENNVNKLTVSASFAQLDQMQFAEDINNDEIMDSIGQDELDAITGALDMFRQNNTN